MPRNANGISYLLSSCLGTVRLCGQANSSLSTSYQHPRSLFDWQLHSKAAHCQ